MAKNSEHKKPKPFDFEKALKRLEEIVEELENRNPPLNKALELFQEGKKLSRLCNKELTSLERKVRMIVEDAEGNASLEDFEPQTEPDIAADSGVDTET